MAVKDLDLKMDGEFDLASKEQIKLRQNFEITTDGFSKWLIAEENMINYQKGHVQPVHESQKQQNGLPAKQVDSRMM